MLQISFWNILFTVINVLILYALIRKFLFKPVHKILDAREQEIKKQYDDAAAAEKQANEMKQQYEDTLKNADALKAESVADAKKQAAAEYDRIVASANKESEKIVAQARDKAKAAANEEIRKAEEEIIAMVKDAAGEIAEAESDQRLYDTFLTKVSNSED